MSRWCCRALPATAAAAAAAATPAVQYAGVVSRISLQCCPVYRV